MPIPKCRPYNHKWNLDFAVGDEHICCQECGHRQKFIALGALEKGEVLNDFFALTPANQHDEIKQRFFECCNDATVRARISSR